MRIVVATFNSDKRKELEDLLGHPEVEITSLADYPGATAPVEDGATLADNARIKARAALALTGLPSIADDTGLEVDALGGRPGVHASRYAGENATYADNVRKMIAAMRDVPRSRRTARFRTVCVAYFPDGREVVGEGVLEGHIIETPRGSGGFGYDPIFELENGKTLAELSAVEKNAGSHRARAVRDLRRRLEEAGLLAGGAYPGRSM